MSNTPIAKTPAAPAARTPDIFSAMRQEMNRVLDSFDRGWTGLPGLLGAAGAADCMSPGLDVRDDGGQIVVEAELPGVAEKDVNVTLAAGLLTISGEKKSEHEEKKANYYLSERSFGSFSRSVRLPDTVDEAGVTATFDKGVLRITAPKKPEAVKAERKITIGKG